MMIEEWQMGNDSKTPSIERSLLHQEWLKQQHLEVKKEILQREKKEQPDVECIGFID